MNTPYFLYDGDMIAKRCGELSSAFANMKVRLFYAIKANDNPHVVRIAQEHGIGACLVASGEMKRALAGGISPSAMLMNGVGKSETDISFALLHEIGQLNVESLPELTKIAEIAANLGKKARICLRINPIIEAKTHSHTATARITDKFGILVNDIEKAAEIIARYPDQLDWRGFSCHIGSQIHGTDELADSYRYMADLFKTWRQKVPGFDRLDLGGGFGVSYTGDAYAQPSDYAALVHDTCGDLMADGVTIQLEPGRFIAAEAGELLTTVLYVKQSGGIHFLIVDAAMNNLIRPAMYGAHHPVRLVRESDAPTLTYTIAGPVCESGDVFGTSYVLAGDVQAGDRLAITYAGAYGFAMSSNYNARGFLPEYMKRGDTITIIREGLTAERFDEITLAK